MLGLLLLAGAAVAQPPAATQAEADHALRAGRVSQARTMIAAAVIAGANGTEVDRLLADLAHASGRHQEALARYRELLSSAPADGDLLQRAAIAALHAGRPQEAGALAARAVAQPNADWRAWNARGVAADQLGDWPTADEAYSRGLALAPEGAELLNNWGWSRLLRGEWATALALFERANSSESETGRMRNNLELARAALAAELPGPRPGESADAWAVRLNDVGVMAELAGDRKRAVAAFARAIEARRVWYGRAANNLTRLGEKP